jgi:hypothetical protein
MVNRAKVDPTDAETMAIQALGFIAADPERLGYFLAATGIGPADIRAAARDRSFLAGVLDHLADNESVMLDFARENGIEPASIVHARHILSGPPVERDIP